MASVFNVLIAIVTSVAFIQVTVSLITNNFLVIDFRKIKDYQLVISLYCRKIFAVKLTPRSDGDHGEP